MRTIFDMLLNMTQTVFQYCPWGQSQHTKSSKINLLNIHQIKKENINLDEEMTEKDGGGKTFEF